jgi:5-methylcytosine-specific restriction endonuclease McrA
MAATIISQRGRTRRASQVEWEQRNRERRCAEMRSYYARNRARIRAQQAEYRRRLGDVKREMDAAYYEANKERIKENVKRWCRENREAKRAHQRRYKARKRGASVVEPYDRQLIFERDEWTCSICGGAVDRELDGQLVAEAPTIDHVIPLSRDGHDASYNVALAHKGCNSRKHNHVEGVIEGHGRNS